MGDRGRDRIDYVEGFVPAREASLDWREDLSRLGGLAGGSGGGSQRSARLRATLSQALATPERELSSRELECLRALLLAISGQFPSLLDEWFHHSSRVRARLGGEPSGREIKLARIAARNISRYL